MAPPFRLGLIGAGRMGRTHLRGLAGSERVAVTAIAEVSEATRRTVPDVGAPVYPGIAEMLDSETLDGVLIVVPTDRHLQVITEVAARGLPILCEKPCGLTVAQTRAAVAATEAAGVPFQVAYWRRYVPALRALRDQIAAGELGTVHLVACYQWDDRPPSDEFRAHSGGILIDMGVHEFDEMRWLTGQEIGSMAAIASGAVPGGLVRHDSGAGPRRSADVDSAQVLVELSGGGSGLVSPGALPPRRGHGTRRGVWHKRNGSLRLPRPRRGRAGAARRAAPAGGKLRRLRVRRHLHRCHRGRRDCGAGRGGPRGRRHSRAVVSVPPELGSGSSATA